MTKTLVRHFPVMLLIMITVACKKSRHTEEPAAVIPDYVLKSIEWDNGVTSNFSYHSDGTLQTTEYQFEDLKGKTEFKWTGKKLMEFYDDRSMYKNQFTYDNYGKVIEMRSIPKTGSGSTGSILEFHYDAQSRPDSLKYFVVNEAGKHLQNSTSYRYNRKGDLEEAITVFANTTIQYTIDAFSSPVNFAPCNYIETSIGENYAIYNYAIMSHLKKANKLPAKVTCTIQHASGPPYIDKIEEQHFTVTNYRIDKVTTTVNRPLTPGNIQTVVGVYSYF